MEPRPSETDAFMVELNKRKRNLNKQLEKIAQAEVKASQGHKLVDDQVRKLANKARYEEQLVEIEQWIGLYVRTHGVKVPEKPKPVEVEQPKEPEKPEKPDTRVPDIVRLWLTGSFLTDLKEKFDADHLSGVVLAEFLAFWKYIQGAELEVYEDVAGRAQALLQKYLDASDELAPQTTRTFAELKAFVEESAVWLEYQQRPVAVVDEPIVEEKVVSPPVVEAEPADWTEPTTYVPADWSEPAQEETKADVHEHVPETHEEEPKRGGWAEEDEEEVIEDKKPDEAKESDDFTIFTKKKKPVPQAAQSRGRPRGQYGNRGPRRPRGKFQGAAKPGPE